MLNRIQTASKHARLDHSLFSCVNSPGGADFCGDVARDDDFVGDVARELDALADFERAEPLDVDTLDGLKFQINHMDFQRSSHCENEDVSPRLAAHLFVSEFFQLVQSFLFVVLVTETGFT